MRKTSFALFLILLLLGCEDHHKKYVIGVSQCSEDIWRDKLNRELKTAEYFNDSLEVVLASANDNSQKQIAQINHFVNAGVDLIIVAPNQYKSITTAIENAYRKGIPVILYDRKVATDKYTAAIGGDNYGIGKAMGNFVGHRLHGHGRVVEIRGLEGSSPATERHKGFVDALKAFEDVRLVASEAGDWKEESGIKAMDNILERTRQFDYVFGHNDRMAWGAYMSLRKHGVERMPKFVGVDALATEGGGLELVRDGLFEASYVYPTKGDEVIALAMKILRGQPYRRENPLTTTIVTRENAELLLMEAKDMVRQNSNLDLMHKKVDAYFNQYTMQRWFIVLLAVVLVCIIIAVVVTYRAYLDKAKLNAKLTDSNVELQRLNAEVKDMTQAQLAFFTNVSHELRTPLTLIADPIDRLLESTGMQVSTRQTLEMVRRNVRVLAQLVNEILDFRKVQSGKMELRLGRFAIARELREWCAAFKSAAEAKGVRLVMECHVDDEETIMADAEKINHLYMNLMSNALKYTSGGGSVTTIIKRQGDHYIICVEDTGVGMAREDLPNVFDRFYQAHGTVGGTGIGLALVKAFAELHQGKVSVESEMGKGTRFVVKLPVRQAGAIVNERTSVGTTTMPVAWHEEGPVNVDTHLDDVVSADKTAKPEILVIDDNDDVRSYLKSILRGRYHVMESANGKDGLALARKMVPDVVVCDVMMPVMDGLEVTRALKTHTETSHIPVILLTARTLDEQMTEGYETGADSYITKPFSSKVLLARIGNLLQNRERLRQLFAKGETAEFGRGMETKAPEASARPLMGDRDTRFIANLRAIIQASLSDPDLNVERIGEEVGLSRVQLYRKVKALTGRSPVELLRTARLLRGKKLLETTGQSISEVAYAVGFTSPSYFTKCFKDEFGASPSELMS